MRGVLPVLGVSLLVGSPRAALAAGQAEAPAEISEHANLGFGRALAADGDRLAVGVPGDDSRGFEAGAVHVYGLAGGRWELQARLLPASDGPFVRLGGALALQGDRLLVGGAEPDEVEGQHGVAYLFEADGERWTQRERWVLDEAAILGEAVSVALDGSTLAFGASFHRPTADTPGGRVRVWQRTGGAWVEEADLLAEPGRDLGDVLALRGVWLLAGSRGSFSGRVEIYRRGEDGRWSRQDDLELPPTASDTSPLGAMAVYANTLAILDDDLPRLHLYALGADGWRFAETRVLDAVGRYPGEAVAIGPGRVAFATQTEDFMSHLVTEQVHLLRLEGGAWVDDGDVDRGATEFKLRTQFGRAVALADDELLVAAPDHGATWYEHAGQVHAYTRGSKGWKGHQLLGPDDPQVAAGCALGGEPAPFGLGLLPLWLLRRRRTWP